MTEITPGFIVFFGITHTMIPVTGSGLILQGVCIVRTKGKRPLRKPESRRKTILK
jgi:hypothetical protein